MKFFLALLVLAFTNVHANEAALYDPEPPADAAFVRVLNALDDATVQASLNNQPVTSDVKTRISDYYVKTKGDYTITAGTIEESLSLDGGKYYTIALHDDKVTLFDDEIMRNPAKAGLYFYNMTDEAASLSAPKFKTTIFEDVAAGSTTSREINAVSFDLEANAGAYSKTLPEVKLERRQGTTIILLEQDGVISPIVVQNAVNK